MTSQNSSIPSADQNHHSRVDQVLRHDQGGLYSKIRSHVARSDGDDGSESYNRDMRELQELFSKLNPMAQEFVPPSLTKQGGNGGLNGGFFTSAGSFFCNNGFAGAGNGDFGNENGGFRRKKSFGQGKRRMNARTSMAQREDVIRRPYMSLISINRL